jgi:predicted MFS family arabinose efflux permease
MGSLVLITNWASKNFSVLAGTILAIGGLGGLLATTPLTILSELYGWRTAFWISAVITFVIALLYFIIIKDEPNATIDKNKNIKDKSLNIFKIIKQRDFKYMVPMSLMSYSALVVVLGLWGAPYLKDIQGLNSLERGQVLMLMAVSWNIGSFVFGYLNKIFGSYKRVVIFGSCGTIILLNIISFIPVLDINFLFILFSFFGFFGAFSVALIAHYQSLHKKNHMGKALTTANFFNFGGVFLMQWITGKIIFFVNGENIIASKHSYVSAFLFLALSLFIALIIYMFSNDKNTKGKIYE